MYRLESTTTITIHEMHDRVRAVLRVIRPGTTTGTGTWRDGDRTLQWKPAVPYLADRFTCHVMSMRNRPINSSSTLRNQVI